MSKDFIVYGTGDVDMREAMLTARKQMAQEERAKAKAPELLAALRALLHRIEDMTTEEFSQGGERPEREAARALLRELDGDAA